MTDIFQFPFNGFASHALPCDYEAQVNLNEKFPSPRETYWSNVVNETFEFLYMNVMLHVPHHLTVNHMSICTKTSLFPVKVIGQML